MDENSDDDLNCIDDININFAYQKQLLENLKNKYNVNITKPSSSSSNSTSSQQSLPSKSSSIKRTNSSSSSTSNEQQYPQGVKSNNKISTKSANKSKPTNYENVTVIIDFELLKTFDQGILNELDSLEIKYELKNQLYSNLITWCYGSDSAINSQCETALLILNWKDVVDYVSSNTLIKHIKSILEVLVGKKITLGLYGFENYFRLNCRYWRLQKQYDKQEKNCNKKYSDYKDSIKISRYELEYVLTEVELRHLCCHRFLENTQELAQIISQYTKSIAQLPEKLEKHEKFKNLDFCMVKDARDCVLVDKNGNGSRRLWQQQLTAFDLVRLETAEAILSKYPTPSKLFQAYSNCNSKAEGIKLLEDIPIRRAAGPLSTTRKVGPELSAKIYNFFNATDGNTLI